MGYGHVDDYPMIFTKHAFLLGAFGLIFCHYSSTAQERLAPLRSGTVSVDAATTSAEAPAPVTTSATTNGTRSINSLVLPFFDDFSGDSPTLQTDLWATDSSYISRDMPLDAPSFGAVVLDALNRYGLPYSNTPLQWGKAEDLTSQPINLDYAPADSVYFSFFCQSGGLGNVPENEDSLVLQFYKPLQDRWTSVWNRAGTTPAPFGRVMEAILDTAYLHDGFRFRFRKYGTLSGNLDHWLIDYVYLDANRTATDTLFDDVAIVRPLLPMFQHYETVPYRHLLEASNPQLRTGQLLYFKNHSATVRNVNFGYELIQDGNLIFSSPVLFNNSNPGVLDSFNLQYNFAGLNDNGTRFSEISIRHYLRTLPDVVPGNDTLVKMHVLSDFYAYDDGSAERGYTINAQFGKVAMKFAPMVSDTLRGVDLYFAPVLEDPTLNDFRIAIWTSSNGVPGNLIYKSDTFATPQYTQLNEFVRVAFDTILLITDTVFVGYEQRYDSDLYVGWDMNRIQQNKLYYNVDNSWMRSEIEGTLMLRPVFGAPITTTLSTTAEVYSGNSLRIYPNPAREAIYLHRGGSGVQSIQDWSILDALGRVQCSGRGADQPISLRGLAPGLYTVKVQWNDGSYAREKLLVQ